MSRQAAPASPPRPAPLLTLLPAAGALLLLAGAAWALSRQRAENAALRGEIASLTQAQRASSSRESAAGAALSRLADTEAALAKAHADLSAASSQSGARIAELEHLVEFLRGEVSAGQQTIERMKAEAATAAQPSAAPAKPSQGKR